MNTKLTIELLIEPQSIYFDHGDEYYEISFLSHKEWDEDVFHLVGQDLLGEKEFFKLTGWYWVFEYIMKRREKVDWTAFMQSLFTASLEECIYPFATSVALYKLFPDKFPLYSFHCRSKLWVIPTQEEILAAQRLIKENAQSFLNTNKPA